MKLSDKIRAARNDAAIELRRYRRYRARNCAAAAALCMDAYCVDKSRVMALQVRVRSPM